MPGKLTYFNDLGGRAEAIRALCFLANHEYEDNRISSEQWADMKSHTPMGALPLWEEDGYLMCQTNAILRFLGKKLGYYSSDPIICYNIDSLLDFFEEGVW